MPRNMCLSIPALLLLTLCACQHDPMRYIPLADRNFMAAQSRMGADGADGQMNGGATSVESMLAHARSTGVVQAGAGGGTMSAAAKAGVVSVAFTGADVQPDETQRARIREILPAAKVQGRATVVGSKDPADTNYLGQRRATAVANILLVDIPGTMVRFDKAVPSGTVIISVRDITPGRVE